MLKDNQILHGLRRSAAWFRISLLAE